MIYTLPLTPPALFKALALLSLFVFLSQQTAAQTTLILQPDSDAGQDAWIWSFEDARNVNFGVQSSVNGGLHNVIRAEVWQWSNRSDTIRGLLKFDFSGLPKGATITSAKLSLYFYANPNFTQQVGDNNLVIRKITSLWDERTVTWNNQPSTTDNNSVTLPPSTSETQEYLDIDVTTLVKEMAEDQERNFGFMFAMRDEVVFRGLTFASSDHSDPTKHPKLAITYARPSDVTEEKEAQSSIQFRADESGRNLYINVAPSSSPLLNVHISDASGRNVRNETYPLSANSRSLTVNLEDLADGVYFVVLQDQKTSAVRKIVLVDGQSILIDQENT